MRKRKLVILCLSDDASHACVLALVGQYFCVHCKYVINLRRIQDLMTGGSDKRPPALSYCYYCLTSPFLKENVWYCVSL